jgi:hypothetical protein
LVRYFWSGVQQERAPTRLPATRACPVFAPVDNGENVNIRPCRLLATRNARDDSCISRNWGAIVMPGRELRARGAHWPKVSQMPHCGMCFDLMTAPESSVLMADGVVSYLWICDSCGQTLVTHCSNAATNNRRVSLSRQWAPNEDNQLRSLIVAGERPAEISVRLRRSIGAVYARAHRFRLSFKRVQQRPR